MKHCKKRLEERFYTEIDKNSLKKLNNNIQGLEITIPCMFIKHISNRLTEWLILVNNKWTICYYDKNKNSIVTFVQSKVLEQIELIDKCIKIWEQKQTGEKNHVIQT